jgi:hypothetical protein
MTTLSMFRSLHRYRKVDLNLLAVVVERQSVAN